MNYIEFVRKPTISTVEWIVLSN